MKSSAEGSQFGDVSASDSQDDDAEDSQDDDVDDLQTDDVDALHNDDVDALHNDDVDSSHNDDDGSLIVSESELVRLLPLSSDSKLLLIFSCSLENYLFKTIQKLNAPQTYRECNLKALRNFLFILNLINCSNSTQINVDKT